MPTTTTSPTPATGTTTTSTTTTVTLKCTADITPAKPLDRYVMASQERPADYFKRQATDAQDLERLPLTELSGILGYLDRRQREVRDAINRKRQQHRAQGRHAAAT